MNYCVGLTGGAGSGKSVAADFFKAQGVAVTSADTCAKILTQPGSPVLAEIVTYFGQSILTPLGELNRRLLRQRIVAHPLERAWLEGLLHPLIRNELIASVQCATSPYCVLEIPLLTRREDYPYVTRVLLIECSKKYQINRLLQRDQCTRQHALQLLSIQPSKASYRQLADDIVPNNGNVGDLTRQLQQLHSVYLQQAQLI